MSERQKALGVVIAVVTLHFQIASIGGFPVTLAPFLLVGLILRTGTRPAPLMVGVGAVSLGAPLLGLIGAAPFSGTQFVRTYSLWALALIAIAVVLSGPARVFPAWAVRGTFWSLCAVSMYTIAQYVLATKGHNTLYNPFGSHQYLYQYDPNRQFGLVRATGFYLEPSFDALVLSSLLFILLLSDYAVLSSLLACSAALYCTRSASGLVIIAVLGAVALRRSVVGRARHRRYRYLLGAAAIVAALSLLGPYLTHRATSATINGSSAEYRLVAPLPILSNVLHSHVFGQPMGSMQRVVASYEIMNGSSTGTSIDNGVYLIAFYLGWVGVLAMSSVALSLLFGSSYGRMYGPRTLLLFLVCVLTNTGGVLLPEFVLLLCVVCCAWRAQAKTPAEYVSPRLAVT